MRANKIVWFGLLTTVLISGLSLLNPRARIVNLTDDGLFFVRYAHNFITTGRFSWNPGEGPAFGATSQLYQLIVTAVQALCRHGEPYSVIIVSTICGIVTVVLLIIILKQAIASFQARWLASTNDANLMKQMSYILSIFGITLILLNAAFYQQWYSGLETTLSTLLVAVFVITLPKILESSPAMLVGLPVLTLALFWQRPDLGLIGTMPLIVGVLSGRNGMRRKSTYASLVTASLLLATLAVWKAYYGVFVPLPSIIKTGLGGYSRANIDHIYAYGNIAQLRFFLHYNDIAALCCIIFLVLWKRIARVSFTVTDLTLGLAALAYALFQTVGNKYPITSGWARFFMPTLPILLYFAFQGFGLLLSWYFLYRKPKTMPSARMMYTIGALSSLLVVLTQGPLLLRIVIKPALEDALHTHPQSNYDALISQMRREDKWTELLPELTNRDYDHCSIADSEIGGIGLLPPSRVVLDMSGLNNIDLTALHETPMNYLERKKPDYVYYRYIDFYWGVVIEDDSWFTSNYTFYPSLGIATRNNSGCTVQPPTDGKMHLGAITNVGVK